MSYTPRNRSALPIGQFTGAAAIPSVRSTSSTSSSGSRRRPVELVDERQNRQPVPAAHLEQLPRLIFDAVGRVDDHHDAVGGDEGAIGVLAEVVVPGRVESDMRRPCSSNSSAAEVIEMPRCCSSSIQSDVAWRRALRPRTAPASSMAPAYSSSFSVSVVLPASGCEMIAKVRRLATSRSSSARNGDALGFWGFSGTGSKSGRTP